MQTLRRCSDLACHHSVGAEPSGSTRPLEADEAFTAPCRSVRTRTAPRRDIRDQEQLRVGALGRRIVSAALTLMLGASCSREVDENAAQVSRATGSKSGPAERRPFSPPSSAASVRKECPAPMDDTTFFPGGSLGPRDDRLDLDAFRRRWYSPHLRAMAEPSLSCGAPEAESYRFLWLRSFHAPIAVRLTAEGDAARLTSVELSGAGGYEPGVVADRTERLLSREEWAQARDAVSVADFWATPSWNKSLGPDGSQWVIEGRVHGKYHVVDRWSPRNGPVRELGLVFLRLARVSVPDVD